MTASAVATRPAAPPAGAWIRSCTPSGAWRLEHVATRSLIFVGRDASEAAIAQRLAGAEATIGRLQGKRAGG